MTASRTGQKSAEVPRLPPRGPPLSTCTYGAIGRGYGRTRIHRSATSHDRHAAVPGPSWREAYSPQGHWRDQTATVKTLGVWHLEAPGLTATPVVRTGKRGQESRTLARGGQRGCWGHVLSPGIPDSRVGSCCPASGQHHHKHQTRKPASSDRDRQTGRKPRVPRSRARTSRPLPEGAHRLQSSGSSPVSGSRGPRSRLLPSGMTRSSARGLVTLGKGRSS